VLGRAQRFLNDFEQLEHTGEGGPGVVGRCAYPALESSFRRWVELEKEAHDGPPGC